VPEGGCTPETQLIFLVQADLEVCRLVRQQLEQAGHTLRTFLSSGGVIRNAEEMLPGLIMIDLALEGRGLELCRRIRRSQFLDKTPIVFLVHEATEEDRISGLEAGADDCIVVPCNPRELVVRVQAVLRRFDHPATATLPLPAAIMKMGSIEIDRSAMKVSISGNEVTTTTLEFRLMEYLARHQGRVFTRDQLLDAVWGDTRFVTPRSVDACVRRIRRKIEPVSAPNFLKTIRGVGYKFDG
jgi:DNA-binding response OmpR family regulator